MVADCPCCTVVDPVRVSCGTSLDTIVVVAEPGDPTLWSGPPTSETTSVLSGSTNVFCRVRIWIVVDAASAGSVNGPGAITSFDVAAPPSDTEKVIAGCVAGFALTTNVAAAPLLTTEDVETIVSVGPAAALTSGSIPPGPARATALVIVGGPMVSPADVSAPSSYPAPCWSATFTVCEVCGVAPGYRCAACHCASAKLVCTV